MEFYFLVVGIMNFSISHSSKKEPNWINHTDDCLGRDDKQMLPGEILVAAKVPERVWS